MKFQMINLPLPSTIHSFSAFSLSPNQMLFHIVSWFHHLPSPGCKCAKSVLEISAYEEVSPRDGSGLLWAAMVSPGLCFPSHMQPTTFSYSCFNLSVALTTLERYDSHIHAHFRTLASEACLHSGFTGGPGYIPTFLFLETIGATSCGRMGIEYWMGKDRLLSQRCGRKILPELNECLNAYFLSVERGEGRETSHRHSGPRAGVGSDGLLY